MTYLTCTQSQAQLPLFVGGECEDPAAVAEHLAGCSACRTTAECLVESRGRLAELASERLPVSSSVWPAVRVHLLAEGRIGQPTPQTHTSRVDARRTAWSPRLWAPLAAAAALLLLFWIVPRALRPVTHSLPAPVTPPVVADGQVSGAGAILVDSTGGGLLRKARADEAPMILEALPLDFERGPRGRRNDPDRLWLVGDEVH